SRTAGAASRGTSRDFLRFHQSLRAEARQKIMKGKILIVDDLEGFRILIQEVLGADYETFEADSGAALQKAFEQNQPDVVLLDVHLPDANGLELLPQIKKRWPDTEVIVLTGHGTISMAVEAGRGG